MNITRHPQGPPPLPDELDATRPDFMPSEGATLEVVAGEASHGLFPLLRAAVRIGRTAANDLVLHDRAASRVHAEIRFEQGRFVVVDQGSANGVFVDGERVDRRELRAGSRIQMGTTQLVLSLAEPDVPAERRQSLIDGCELLSGLDDRTRAELARSLVPRYFPGDALVLDHRVAPEGLLFLVSGEVRIVEINDAGGERQVGRLGPGDHFGERALLPGLSGRWSMLASTPVWALELPQRALDECVQRRPEVSATMRSSVKKLLASGTFADGRLDLLAPGPEVKTVELLGQNRRFLSARKKIEKVVADGRTPLIVGAAGTGKRTAARYCHRIGVPDQPYAEISLTEIEPAAVEATLFGVEADPDAPHMRGRMGYLEMLGEGTLVIAHSQLLGPHLQSKLLTYLRTGWFHRAYGQAVVRSATRVVLLAEGSEAALREHFIPELHEELNGAIVELPPLVRRLKDIPLLAEHFLQLHARKAGRAVEGFTREATERLLTYSWPGNLAELDNVIQRALIVASESAIIPGDLIFVEPAERDVHKRNLLRLDRLRSVLSHPALLRTFMWINLAVVGLVTVFTLWGGLKPPDHPLQHFDTNPGMLVTWLVWFPLLPLSALLLGRIWCGVCPIALFGDLVARVKRFNLPVPKLARRLDFWLLAGSFLFLDFVEEFFEVAHAPLATGMLLAIIFASAAALTVLYERRTFCRYLCPLAGLLGTYATLSPFEIRGNKKVCQTQCGEHTCFKGTDRTPGCPIFAYPASINSNTECMLCGYCLRSCGNRGVQLNLRPPLQELWQRARPVLAVSIFAVILVGMMGRHQFSELPAWEARAEAMALSPHLTYTLLYGAFMLLVLVPFLVSSVLSSAASRQSLSSNMASYGMAFIPLALAGHLAHVTHEVVGEGFFELLAYVRKVWDAVFGGVPIAQSQIVVEPLIHAQVVTLLKLMLILAGILGSVVAVVMIGRRDGKADVFPRVLPHLLLLGFFGTAYLMIFWM